MSRGGAKAMRLARAEPVVRALFEHESPTCPLRPENLEKAAEGDRPLLRCTCAWDLAR